MSLTFPLVSVQPPQDEKQRFTAVLLLARLLAKFLGFISFLPYQTAERPSREIQETAIELRSKVRMCFSLLVLVDIYNKSKLH